MPNRRIPNLLFYWSLISCTLFFTCSREASVLKPGDREVRTSFAAAMVVINEYLADPPPALAGDANGDGTRDAAQDEFVELVNTGAAPLDISGFTIRDATGVRFTIPPGKIMPAGEAAVVFGGGVPTGSFGNA